MTSKVIILVSISIVVIIISIFTPLILNGYFNSTSPTTKKEKEDDVETIEQPEKDEKGKDLASLIFDDITKKWKQSNGKIFVIKDQWGNILNTKFDKGDVNNKIIVNGVIYQIESISSISDDPFKITFSRFQLTV